MLAPAQRLRRRDEFAATIRAGRRAGRGAVVVHLDAPAIRTDETAPARTGDTQLPARAGFVVPKTVGNAVTRNKVRRRLRHLVRERLGEFAPSTAVVIRALPGAADRGYPELAADLDAALAAARNRRPRRPSGDAR